MNTTSLAPSRLLRRTEAAQHIHDKWGYPCSPRTLAKYAVIGGGPPFRKAGRYPLYHPDDLDEWVASKLSPPMRSTSDTASPKAGITDCCLQPDLGETSSARKRRGAL